MSILDRIRSAFGTKKKPSAVEAPSDPNTVVARVPGGLRPGDKNPAAGPEDVAATLRDAGADVEAYDPKKDMPQ
jgi:hypothetical protein